MKKITVGLHGRDACVGDLLTNADITAAMLELSFDQLQCLTSKDPDDLAANDVLDLMISYLVSSGEEAWFDLNSVQAALCDFFAVQTLNAISSEAFAAFKEQYKDFKLKRVVASVVLDVEMLVAPNLCTRKIIDSLKLHAAPKEDEGVAVLRTSIQKVVGVNTVTVIS